MRTLKLTLAYDGAAYSGWQAQPGRSTIQGALERVLERICGEPVRTVASGRTDAGVHALGQVVSCNTTSSRGADEIQRALNAELPEDIAVLEVRDARPGFHAIRDAIKKRYRYVLCDAAVRDVFERGHAWYLPQRLDVEAMHRAAQALVGEHDFASFQSSGSQRETTVRTVLDLSVTRCASDADLVHCEIEADGYLYNMVRAIVGTLVEVGRGTKPPEWPGEVLEKCDRRAAGRTAPPHGLFLMHVTYPAE